jgi:hypothetical protein
MTIRLFPILILLALPAGAQTSVGLATPWDFKKTIASLASYSKRLQPLLDQLNPSEWRDAPEGYAAQQKLVKTQLDSISLLTQDLSKDPERLPVVLDLFFRYENFDQTLGSLLEGVRRYQNPAVADLITGLRNENSGARQGLKDYMVDLASTKDQEYRIVDQEAQRCRGMILKQPTRRN